MSNIKKFRIALVGRKGHGKSCTGNTILRREVFEESDGAGQVDKKTFKIDVDLVVQVYDTPGVMNPDLNKETDEKEAIENMKQLMEISDGIDVFLLVYNYSSKYSLEDKKAVELLESILGPTSLVNHGILVFTHGENLECELEEGESPEEKFAKWCSVQPESFQQLMRRLNHRKILVYNRGPISNDSKRMKSSIRLLAMARALGDQNGPLTKEIFIEYTKNKSKNRKTFRIALVGKTGHGKSCTGNTILRREVFEDTDFANCGTQLVDKKTAVFDNLVVQVFDTPGLMDSDLTEKEDRQKAFNNMEILINISGGIDVFFLVYNYIGRYTQEERETVALLEDILGKTTFVHHGIMVVTHGDSLVSDLKAGETREERFDTWCYIQSKSFQQLKTKMNDRVILVYNNGEFDEGTDRMESSKQLLKMAQELHAKNGPLTKEEFEKFKKKCCVIM